MGKHYEDHWRIAHATPGRAVLIPLPESITEEQIDWFREHLPRTCKVVRPNEPIGNAPRVVEETDKQLEALGSLTAQVTDKKIELLKTEQELSKVKLELEREKLILEERRKYARSFGGAITELADTLGFKIKL